MWEICTYTRLGRSPPVSIVSSSTCIIFQARKQTSLTDIDRCLCRLCTPSCPRPTTHCAMRCRLVSGSNACPSPCWNCQSLWQASVDPAYVQEPDAAALVCACVRAFVCGYHVFELTGHVLTECLQLALPDFAKQFWWYFITQIISCTTLFAVVVQTGVRCCWTWTQLRFTPRPSW